MPDIDLEIAKEAFAEGADLVRTAEDISTADLSQIFFSILADQFGEALAEDLLAIYSDELADLIFEYETIDIPDLTNADPLEQLKTEEPGTADSTGQNEESTKI